MIESMRSCSLNSWQSWHPRTTVPPRQSAETPTQAAWPNQCGFRESCPRMSNFDPSLTWLNHIPEQPGEQAEADKRLR